MSCVPAHANMHMLCGMHHRPRWKQHAARAAFRAGIAVAQGIAIPSHTMFTEDYLRESVVDNILSSASGDLTFADLGISPQRVDIGLPIEHVRHFRIGGGSLRFPPSTRCSVGCAVRTCGLDTMTFVTYRAELNFFPFTAGYDVGTTSGTESPTGVATS